MKLSKKSEYGLRALLELQSTYNGPVLQRHEIAERQHIPVEFLEQILLSLKRAGLLTSRRGIRGGYALTYVDPRRHHVGSGHPYSGRPACADFLREQDRLSKVSRLPLCVEAALSTARSDGRGAQRHRRYS